jgi:Uma2 family endonuclease
MGLEYLRRQLMATVPTIPPLQHGERLSRDEFERRCAAMPHIKKAELIEGVVYMPSPVSLGHGEPHRRLVTWLGVYCDRTLGTLSAIDTTVRLDLNNEPQPDGVLFIDPKYCGQAIIDKDDYVESAPELAAEVSVSSVSVDTNAKLHAYRRNGVLEYIVWRVIDKQIDWFQLVGGKYERLTPDAEGVLKSKVFPGLWLAVSEMLAGDMPKVHEVLHRGLATPEHAAFVAKLQAAKSAS